MNIHLSAKRLLVACGASLFYLLTLSTVIAADNRGSSYQSAFDGYKPMTEDGPTDWKTINTPPAANEHAGHSMQHAMSPEETGEPAPIKAPEPDMKGMNHSKMNHDHTMAPMTGMEHDHKAGDTHAH